MIQLKLYGTEGCHLCDHASALIIEAAQAYSNMEVQYIDIIENDELMDAYSLSIPVLTLSDTNKLFWPFTIEEIKTFIESAQ
jgi:thiol-disulfide isomerase/thioredoxin